MNPGIAIGIDIGTSAVRAALVNAAGAPLAFAAAPLDPPRIRDPRAQADLSAVQAVAVDGTSGTLLPVDAAGVPLAPARMYHDPADPDFVRAIAAEAPADSAVRGGASPLAKLLALQAVPGLARVLHQADWIAGRLCGRFDTADENNALKTGYDPVRRACRSGWTGWRCAGRYCRAWSKPARCWRRPAPPRTASACRRARGWWPAPPMAAPPSWPPAPPPRATR